MKGQEKQMFHKSSLSVDRQHKKGDDFDHGSSFKGVRIQSAATDA